MKYLLPLLFLFPSFTDAQLVRQDGVAYTTLTDTFVNVSGDTMSGPFTLSGSSLTVTGNAFSVGVTTLSVANGRVSIGYTDNNGRLTILSPVVAGEEMLTLRRVGSGSDNRLAFTSKVSDGGYSIDSSATSSGGIKRNLDIVSGLFSVGGSTLVVSGGKVGIGTVSPLAKLHINNGSADNNTSDLLVNEDTWTNDATLELRSGAANIYSSSITWQGSAANLKITAGRSDLGAITLNTLVSGTVTERLRVLNGGTVAIVSGGLRSYSRTMAQLIAITPLAVGEQYFCNNCTPAKMVVSTGTAAGNFAGIMGGTFE